MRRALFDAYVSVVVYLDRFPEALGTVILTAVA